MRMKLFHVVSIKTQREQGTATTTKLGVGLA